MHGIEQCNMYYIDQYIHDKQKTCVILSNDTLDIEQYRIMHVITVEQYKAWYYFILFFVPWIPYSVPGLLFYVQYLAGCRDSNPSCCDHSQVCYQWATRISYELHTFPMSYTHPLWMILCNTVQWMVLSNTMHDIKQKNMDETSSMPCLILSNEQCIFLGKG